ncbi:hypothetical protein A3J23_04020 [Candidatus Peregrinibacteria bacterium RIFCSPLOWO2_02_FULL_48_14]|nr:MAG: hypothetical protein A2974_02580 [Candidatus Peregrinibacteria bacterium RIFCSPLOWO2_01_FULL_48_20]OGJ43679.1 MAG: hypothetical protein A3J23_04020 [Candidatus Peregrinibacteria bacterium RIFCSPLOWO2_02_FULL_48_14]
MHFWKLAKTLPPIFSPKDIQKVLNTTLASAKVLCSRYTKQGRFLKLRRNVYIFKDLFVHMDQEQLFTLGGLFQDKTYISFATALAYHGFLKPVPHFIENATAKRSLEKQIGYLTWRYHHLPEKAFSSSPEEVVESIASPEKAFLDILYLFSLGRYYINLKRINLEALNFNKLSHLCTFYPVRTQKLLGKLYGRALNV